MILRPLALCTCAVITVLGCFQRDATAENTSSQPLASATPSSSPAVPTDACSLLTSAEIEAVLGEAVKEAKPERREEDGFIISQCYFALPTRTNFVTIRLVQKGSDEAARDPRTVWEETFARDLEKAKKERKKAPPEQVPNVGDEAFWLGGPEAGGLYVLKGNRHFRLGLGGEPNQARKIEKASGLARTILERL